MLDVRKKNGKRVTNNNPGSLGRRLCINLFFFWTVCMHAAFTYQAGNDSVLLVDKKAYDACDTNSPMDTFSDGNTVFTFTRSGPCYFISGNRDNCNRNEKLIVVVMADRSAVDNGTQTATGLAPAPNTPFSPSSPPPPFGVNISPATNPPPNAASQKVGAGAAATIALAVGALFTALV
jgi:hypothetical protein